MEWRQNFPDFDRTELQTKNLRPIANDGCSKFPHRSSRLFKFRSIKRDNNRCTLTDSKPKLKYLLVYLVETVRATFLYDLPQKTLKKYFGDFVIFQYIIETCIFYQKEPVNANISLHKLAFH